MKLVRNEDPQENERIFAKLTPGTVFWIPATKRYFLAVRKKHDQELEVIELTERLSNLMLDELGGAEILSKK